MFAVKVLLSLIIVNIPTCCIAIYLHFYHPKLAKQPLDFWIITTLGNHALFPALIHIILWDGGIIQIAGFQPTPANEKPVIWLQFFHGIGCVFFVIFSHYFAKLPKSRFYYLVVVFSVQSFQLVCDIAGYKPISEYFPNSPGTVTSSVKFLHSICGIGYILLYRKKTLEWPKLQFNYRSWKFFPLFIFDFCMALEFLFISGQSIFLGNLQKIPVIIVMLRNISADLMISFAILPGLLILSHPKAENLILLLLTFESVLLTFSAIFRWKDLIEAFGECWMAQRIWLLLLTVLLGAIDAKLHQKHTKEV